MLAAQARSEAEKRRPLPTSLRTLVLNADGRPLSTYPPSIISAQDAVSALWRDRAIVVENWPEAFFRSPSTSVPVPKTMMLRQYANISADPKFCRRSVLLRDRFCCQYCGQRFEAHDLTYDHLVPRSAGGRTTWDNIVTACIPCNAKKRDTLPNFSGRKRRPAADGSMRPLKMPRRPTAAELLRAGLEFLATDIKETWAETLYWGVELDP